MIDRKGWIFRLAAPLLVIFFLIYVFYNSSEEQENYRTIPMSRIEIINDSMLLEHKLNTIIRCYNRDYKMEKFERGEYWVLKNFIQAEHGELRCLETITYTTHSDFTFLDNLVPLLKRWEAPVSIGLHTPGTDFDASMNSIQYMRECIPEKDLVKKYATFHFFFHNTHIPKNIIKDKFSKPIDCSLPPPYEAIKSTDTYKAKNEILYPVNVGRNIARDAAMTHFIFPCDIELYPTPGLVIKFLQMIARNEPVLERDKPRVFPLSLFEVDENFPVPENKTKLQELLKSHKAIPFHMKICPSCHKVPKSKEWIDHKDGDDLGVFHIGKRNGDFFHWEPIFIGTHDDPYYDDRLSWEGQSDKMTQGYALCALDYEFMILDNAFLVHKPGIKVYHKDGKRDKVIAKTNKMISEKIFPELKLIYGTRDGCKV